MADNIQLAELANNTLETLANQIASNKRALSELETYGKIYTSFETDETILNQKKLIINNFWYTNTFDLINIQTGSMQNELLKKFYLETETTSSDYSINYFFISGSTNRKKQFSLFYGHKFGSGSAKTNDYYPSRTIYKQYANKCLEPEDDTFTFGNGINSNHIYGISFSVDSMDDGINPNYFQLGLRQLTGESYPNSQYTGSNVNYKSASYDLISIIPETNPSESILTNMGSVYNLISGSIINGPYTSSAGIYDYYGILYSDLGVIILNADKLDLELSFNSVSGSDIDGFNSYKLFKSIEGATVLNNGSSSISSLSSPPKNSFIIRKNKFTNTNYYFVYIRSFEYNYSTNPTYVTGNSGQLKYKAFMINPVSYITSIGLYNDFNDLLAIAKISKPLRKEFGKEYLVKIKLEF
jgi:hypothetical protein